MMMTMMVRLILSTAVVLVRLIFSVVAVVPILLRWLSWRLACAEALVAPVAIAGRVAVRVARLACFASLAPHLVDLPAVAALTSLRVAHPDMRAARRRQPTL